jgi:HPr kinase/phosphorylase
MARLVEVAALVQALKLMGHDSAKAFNERLIAHMESQSAQEGSEDTMSPFGKKFPTKVIHGACE